MGRPSLNTGGWLGMAKTVSEGPGAHREAEDSGWCLASRSWHSLILVVVGYSSGLAVVGVARTGEVGVTWYAVADRLVGADGVVDLAEAVGFHR